MTAPRATRPVRRLVLLLAAATLLALAPLAPASADVPLGWDPEQQPVPFSHILWLILAIFGAILIIMAAVYLPAIARGESVRPGAGHPDAEWFGGPNKAPSELAAPDTDESQAGGARGNW